MESLFELEVREKRRQAFLNNAKTGSKGGSRSRKGVRTPSDFMSPKEKKNLNSEVRISNMYEQIIPKKVFDALDFEKQKAMFTYWRENFTSKSIMEGMQVKSPGYISSYCLKFGLPTKSYNKKNQNPDSPKPIKEQKPKTQQLVAVIPSPDPVAPTPAPMPMKLITNGLHFEYNGEYETEQINKILTKLQLLLDGEPGKFNIEISVTERIQ